MKSGMVAAESVFAAFESAAKSGAAVNGVEVTSYETNMRASPVWKELHEGMCCDVLCGAVRCCAVIWLCADV